MVSSSFTAPSAAAPAATGVASWAMAPPAATSRALASARDRLAASAFFFIAAGSPGGKPAFVRGGHGGPMTVAETDGRSAPNGSLERRHGSETPSRRAGPGTHPPETTMPDRSDIQWFKTQFQARIAPALAGTPLTVDLLTAIACQETGEVWPLLRHKN